MRSLPPPRYSRARRMKRVLRYLYRILSLQFLFDHRRHRNNTIVIKKRISPFHRPSRRYKVKTPRRGKRVHWYHFHRVRGNVVLDARVLGELSREFEQLANNTQSTRRSRRDRAKNRARSVLRLRVVARRALRWLRASRGRGRRSVHRPQRLPLRDVVLLE